MTPVVHCSISNICLFPGGSSSTRRESRPRKCNVSERHSRLGSSSLRLLLPCSGLHLIQIHSRSWISNRGRIIKAAVETDVTVEEPNTASSKEVANESSGPLTSSVETSEQTQASPVGTSTTKMKRARTMRKSDMPPVKDEELVPGASFTGKVRSIQPFGLFVDFGAFTDGLVHVSCISDEYVKDVAALFSLGQEVQVKIVEANKESRRISLTMRSTVDPAKVQQKKEPTAGGSGEKTRAVGRISSRSKAKEVQKSTKLVKGQILSGTVKNLTRSGAFVSLPDGEEGFLPVSEESEGFGSILGNSSLEAGQEVSVRVLRIVRGQVTLTMKKEEDLEGLNIKLNQGVVHVATNPFELAFRRNREISAFLDERERTQKSINLDISKTSSAKVDGIVDSEIDASAVIGQLEDDKTNMASELEDKKVKDEVLLDQASSSDQLKFETGPITKDEALQLDNPATSKDDLEDEKTDVEKVNDPSSSRNQLEGDGVNTINESEVLGSVANVNETEEEKTDTEKLHDEASSRGQPDGKAKTASESNALQIDGYATSNNDKLEDEKTDDVKIHDETSVTDSISSSVLSKGGETSHLQGAVLENERPAEDEESIKIFSSFSADSLITDTTLPVDVQDSTAANNDKEDQSLSSFTEISERDELSKTGTPDSSRSSIGSVSETTAKIAMPQESSVPEALMLNEIALTGTENDDGVTVGSITLEDENIGSLNEGDISSSESIMDEGSSEAKDSNAESKISAEPDLHDRTSRGDAVEGVATSQSEDTFTNGNPQIESPLLIEKESTLTDVKDSTLVKTEASNEKNGNIDSQSSSKAQNATAISPALVKQLREETGAGMMDCKRALAETGGDIIKAQEFLRKKGLASADKKASRATAEGRIGSYVHDNRIGVLIEVNCETDFVSRGEIFKQLVDDLAMQVVACPQVLCLTTEDVPEAIVNKEREIEMQKEDLSTKPEQIRSKIVDGRIRKRLEELSLLEQPYIKNDKVRIKDWVKQTIATIGENIKVKRFVRYNLGEGLEKKSQDFAAEVAAQTAAKPAAAIPKDKPVETTASVEKAPTVAISAALVKQLREETGAGMMDCKKALSETGGDLEKAQEYLRKKGLSSADKKSSRLAAEGLLSTYIHDTRIGCLIEVNSESDFVARNEKFKELVNDLAMQVVACPQVGYVALEDIPNEIVSKEKEIEMQREDLRSKPENIREKIVEGRITKRLGELALLEQPFIKDDSMTVKELVKQTVAALGENIKVRRFVRYTLGES